MRDKNNLNKVPISEAVKRNTHSCYTDNQALNSTAFGKKQEKGYSAWKHY